MMKPGESWTYIAESIPVPTVLADVTTKMVSIKTEDVTYTMNLDQAIKLARELMHAAYALGYEEKEEK